MNLKTTDDIKTTCGCAQPACDSAAAPGAPCPCGDSCACAAACSCGTGCDCSDER
jgi:hypothetical protein